MRCVIHCPVCSTNQKRHCSPAHQPHTVWRLAGSRLAAGLYSRQAESSHLVGWQFPASCNPTPSLPCSTCFPAFPFLRWASQRRSNRQKLVFRHKQATHAECQSLKAERKMNDGYYAFLLFFFSSFFLLFFFPPLFHGDTTTAYRLP